MRSASRRTCDAAEPRLYFYRPNVTADTKVASDMKLNYNDGVQRISKFLALWQRDPSATPSTVTDCRATWKFDHLHRYIVFAPQLICNFCIWRCLCVSVRSMAQPEINTCGSATMRESTKSWRLHHELKPRRSHFPFWESVL